MKFHWLLFLSNLNLLAHAIHESMNFALGPSTRECFYEDIEKGQHREVEVFVNEGGFLDISLFIYGPLSLDDVRSEKFESYIREERIDAQRQSQSESQTLQILFHAEHEGTYAFCLDNRNAKFITKLVEVCCIVGYYDWGDELICIRLM